jgi:Protein of unknown function (DUF4058)
MNIMPVRLLKNPYQGVNAHLHSMAQNPVRSPTIWTSIHASLIGDITNALNRQLPANYIARTEQSLQIWSEDLGIGTMERRTPRPDTGIFRTGISGSGQSPVLEADSAVRVISIKHLLEDEDMFTPSVVVYRPEENEYMGDPITRIELLSPSNKKRGQDYQAYASNRLMALRSGTSLIELDYLHQTPSPLPEIPAYPDEPASHAYSLAVTDRRVGQNPDVNTIVYLLDVDMTLPTQVVLPLADQESIPFDFDAVYQYTFEVGRWGVHIDYEEPPKNFASYSPPDQERIKQVMERAKSETAQG